MSVADDLASVVTELLDEFGTTATFRSIAFGSRVIGSGSVNVTTETTINVFPSAYSAFEIQAGVAGETDIKIIVDGADFTTPPTTDDELTLLGVTYKIMRITTDVLQGSRLAYVFKLGGN